jgi:hypothetical protein
MPQYCASVTIKKPLTLNCFSWICLNWWDRMYDTLPSINPLSCHHRSVTIGIMCVVIRIFGRSAIIDVWVISDLTPSIYQTNEYSLWMFRGHCLSLSLRNAESIGESKTIRESGRSNNGKTKAELDFRTKTSGPGGVKWRDCNGALTSEVKHMSTNLMIGNWYQRWELNSCWWFEGERLKLTCQNVFLLGAKSAVIGMD